MKSYNATVVETSGVSKELNDRIRNTSDSSGKENKPVPLFQVSSHKPNLMHVYKNELGENESNDNYLCQKLLEENESIDEIVIVETGDGEVKKISKYDFTNGDKHQISKLEVLDFASSSNIRIDTTPALLEGVGDINTAGKDNLEKSYNLLEMFGRRNQQLLDIIDYNLEKW